MSNNTYIWPVKINKILSLCLILLVLMSSTECLTFSDFETVTAEDEAIAQVLEADHDLKQEFRESIKLNLSEETRWGTDVISHKLPMLWLNAYHKLQYNRYHQQFLSGLPSDKLFITFGALII